MDQQAPQDPNKIDLSSVNKEPRQPLSTKLTSLFKNRKKSAGPGRDHLGQFTSGSGGLKSAKKFSWSRALPLVLIVSLVGGYLVFRSFAGTYGACYENNGKYRYDEECVTNSDEASVVRLYFGIFNRAPDKSGLQYWTNKLNNKSVTLTEMARQFMGSNEFKNKYGSLSNQAFVNAMYPQVFGRAPDAGGLKFWTDRLNAKKVTRENMMVQFTESSEMKREFSVVVSNALSIKPEDYTTKITQYKQSDITCHGTKIKINSQDYCRLTLGAKSGLTAAVSAKFPSNVVQDGDYIVCYETKVNSPNREDINNLYSSVEFVKNSVNQNSLQLVGKGQGGAFSNGKYCYSNQVSKNNLETILITASTSNSDPSTSIDVLLDSVYLGRTKDSFIGSSLENQPNHVMIPGPKGNIKFGAVTKDTTRDFVRVSADAKTQGSYLTFETPYFSGKATISGLVCESVNYNSNEKRKFEVVLTDTRTGKVIDKGYELSFTEYSVADSSNQFTRVFQPGATVVLPTDPAKFKSSGWTTLKLNNPTAGKIKITLKVKEGVCQTVNGPDWRNS